MRLKLFFLFLALLMSVLLSAQTIVELSGSHCAGSGSTFYLYGNNCTSYSWSVSGGTKGVDYNYTDNTSDGFSVYWLKPNSGLYVQCSYYCNGSGTAYSPQIVIYKSAPQYTVGGGGSYCSGTNGVSITLSGSQTGVSYQLKRNGGNDGVPISGTGSRLTWSNKTSAGSYTVTATSCPNNMNGSVTVSVNPQPTQYTVSSVGGATSYCSGTNGVSIKLSGSESGINYQLKKNGSNQGSALPGTGSALTWTNQILGTYTVVATNPTTGCTRNMLSSVVVTENPKPYKFSVGGGGVCNSITVTLNGSHTGVAYQLYLNGSPLGISAISGTGSSLAWGSQVTAGTYTVVGTYSTTGCSEQMGYSAILNPTPARPTSVTNGKRCGSGTVTISGTPGSNGNSLKWYTASTGGTYKATGTSYSPSVTSTTTYYASTYNTTTGCESIGTRPGATATVNAIPSIPTAMTGGARCGSGTVTISGTPGSNGNTMKWYTASTGGTYKGTGTSYSPSVTSTTTYYASTYNTTTGCESTATRPGAAARVNAIPSVPTVMTGGARCGSGVVTISGTPGSNGNSLKWYNASIGGTYKSTGTSYSPSISITTTFYASTYNTTTGCESTATRPGATARVNAIPAIPTAMTSGARCGSGSVTISGTPGTNGTTMKWYTASTGGTYKSTGTSYSPSITSTTTYYASSYNTTTGCESTATRPGATATVNAIPSIPTSMTGGARCGSGSVTISGTPGTNGNTMKWYTASTGGTYKSTGTSYSPSVTSTTTYYASSYNTTTGCESTATRPGATATVNAIPAVDAGTDKYFFKDNSSSSLGGTPSGGTWSGTGVSSNSFVPSSVSAGTYTLTYSYTDGNSCSNSDQLTATVYSLPIASITGPAYIARGESSGIAVSGNYDTYQWYHDNVLISGATSQTYLATKPGEYKSRVYKNGANTYTSPLTLYNAMGLSNNMNYIIAHTIQEEGVTDPAQIDNLTVGQLAEQIQYLDGLGRPIQTVTTQGSPGGNDIVQPIIYDEFGRDTIQYLPYVANDKSGLYKSSAIDINNYANSAQAQFYNNASNKVVDDAMPYAVKLLEKSPLNRLLEQGAPGVAWQPGTGHTVKMSYETNIASEVRLFTVNSQTLLVSWSNQYYSAGTLFITKTTDEQDNVVKEYKDKLGNVVLKRVYLIASDILDTYYIYDDFNNLRVVLPPEAIKNFNAQYNTNPAQFLDNWAFLYKYDARQRMTHKKVPGAEWVYMVYDIRDRLILTQDGNQRDTGTGWLFTKYDTLNRPVLTGIYTHSGTVSQSNMQIYVNGQFGLANTFYSEQRGNAVHGYTNHAFPKTNCEYLTATYYDDYDFLTDQPADWGAEYEFIDDYGAYDVEILSPVKGQVTGAKIRVLGTNDWIKSVSYYDRKYRVVQTAASNQLDGVDRSFSKYDFVGKVMQTKAIHQAENKTAKVLEDIFTYDHAGRLIDHYSTIGEAVTWTDLVGVVVENDNDLLKTASKAWGNGGAATENKIPAGKNGWIEMRGFDKPTAATMIGLSTTNANANYTSIEFAIYIHYNNNVYVYESGSNKGIKSTWNEGDIFRVERKGSNIYYLQNSQIIYTSTKTDSEDLIGDIAINFNNAGVHEVYMSTAGTALLAHNDYNELGELVDKQLHSTDNGASFMQSVDYRYNIRGWLTNINESDLSPQDAGDPIDFFGMELGYNTNIGTGADLKHNGNISAIKWSNFGAPEGIGERAYNYGYDNINRLKSASHKVKTGVWADAGNSVKVDNIVYDYNGNIKSLNRRDLLGGNMDLLTYSYGTGINQSNKLLSVTDAGNDLEGFKDGNASGNDYLYDANGNMNEDKNKGILHIWYNHLNLPDSLDMGGGKAIKYTYDAAGVKQRQTVYEGGVVKKQTDYIGGFIYEDTVLQLIQHAEGRITWNNSPLEGGSRGVYEYHLKDHLGNVRLTFTTEPGEDTYTATLENATQQQEQAEFHPSYDNITRSNASIYDHSDNGSSTYSLMIDGQPGKIIGLAKSMQVLPGETVNMQVYGKYLAATSTDNNITSGIATAITGAFGLTASATGELLNAYSAMNGLFSTGPLIGAGDWEDDNAPKAYLNYILFDRNFVPYEMGFDQIDIDALENGSDIAHDVMALEAAVTRPGYIYIYLSNENNKQVEVYFDDLSITHHHTPVIQTDDYYPFGLAIAGLSGRTENKVENNFLFQGQELQEDLDLGWYSFKWRNHQPEIGRFCNVDPLADKYVHNSPYAFSENRVIDGIEIEGLEYARFDILVLNGRTSSITVTKDYGLTNKGTKGPGVEYHYVYVSTTTNGDGNITESTKFVKNMYGIYQGPNNPQLPEIGGSPNDLKDDYSLEPIDEADANAKQHDIDYDKDKLRGAAGVLDARSTKANEDYIDRANNIIDKFEKGENDNITEKPVTEEAKKASEFGKNAFETVEILKKTEFEKAKY